MDAARSSLLGFNCLVAMLAFFPGSPRKKALLRATSPFCASCTSLHVPALDQLQALLVRALPSLNSPRNMTTAHRPTWAPAKVRGQLKTPSVRGAVG